MSNSRRQATSNPCTDKINEYILDLTQDTSPTGLNYTGPAKFYRSVSDMLAQTPANTWAVEYSGNARAGRSLPQPAITNILKSHFNIASTADWNLTSATTLAGQASPDGQTNAVRLTASAGSGTHFVTQTFSKDNNSPYTFSVFLKSVNGRYALMQLGNASNQTNPLAVYVDLQQGIVQTYDMSRVLIKPYGNGWFRVAVTIQTNSAGANLTAQVYLANSIDTGSESFTSDGTESILVWGAMVQKSALPLRAIPVANASAAESVSVNKDHGATRFEITYNTGVKELVTFGAGSATALPTETENWHNRFVAQIRYMA